MKQAYESWSPSANSLALVKQCNAIVAEYAAMKIRLTIRQLYYQCVSMNLLRNTERNYKRLIGIMGNARLAGLTDWSAIEDRTRALDALVTWQSPDDALASHAANYRRDLWATQKNRLEVWIEKEALASVFVTICRELRVDFMCCRGYMSLSELHAAGRRLKLRRQGQSLYGEPHAKQRNVVLHFGDHDPSGMDMTRNVEERLRLFSEGPLMLRRVALNYDQVEQYNPPPNPAKVTDSRYEGYAAEHGDESWELDALNPTVLRDLVRANVMEFRDEGKWATEADTEREERTLMRAVSGRWPQISEYVSDNFDTDAYRDDPTEQENDDVDPSPEDRTP